MLIIDDINILIETSVVKRALLSSFINMAEIQAFANGTDVDAEERSLFPPLLPHLNFSKRVLVIGDLILDHYVYGQCDRVAPDSPVPVFVEKSHEHRLGGAGNVVNNLLQMCVSVDFITICGIEDDVIIKLLSKHGIETKRILKSKNFRVKTIKRYISRNRQYLRVDSHVDPNISQEDVKILTEIFKSSLECVRYDAVVLSDYRKGIFTKEFSQYLISEINALNIPIIVDPKRGEYERFIGSTYIKPNKEDVRYFLDNTVPSKENIQLVCQAFCERLHVKFCIITLAEEGIAWYSHEKGSYQVLPPDVNSDVNDVCGAGDTALAAIAFGIVNKWELQHSCNFANACAANVNKKYGINAVEMIDIIQEKVLRKQEHLKVLKRIIPCGKTIILTTGCFDMLHAGHVDYLHKASKIGDFLVVALNTDNSVKKNKGSSRPILSLDLRLKMLLSLQFIDFIVIFDEETPYWVVETLNPDSFVKGGDYTEADLRAKFPTLRGVKVFDLVYTDTSTTAIIHKVQSMNEIK